MDELDIAAQPQKAAEVYHEKLRCVGSITKLCEVLLPYQLELVSRGFKAFSRQVEDEIKNSLDLSEQDMNDEK